MGAVRTRSRRCSRNQRRRSSRRRARRCSRRDSKILAYVRGSQYSQLKTAMFECSDVRRSLLSERDVLQHPQQLLAADDVGAHARIHERGRLCRLWAAQTARLLFV